MDTTKPMVATDSFNVKIWKQDLENKEDDAMATVELAATSKKQPSEAANIINPLLLQSARVGSWEALKLLLEREDAGKPPMTIPTQEFLDLLARGSNNNAQEKERVAARDEEEGADHHHPPAASSPAAGSLLKGVTPDGDTALHAVARNRKGGHQHFLKYAGIIYDRDPGLLLQRNQVGDTPLHCAARAGNSKMVAHLMDLAGREGGADTKLGLLRMENNRQETALHEAVRFQDGGILRPKDREALLAADPAGNDKDDAEKNIVRLLMGVDPDLANYPAHGRGISPLYLAILLGKSTIAVTLYHKSGGNLSYSGVDGQNALHAAVLQNADTVIIEFLVHWSKTLITQVDKDGSTPLHFAASLIYLRLETLKILFKANRAALYQADNNGFFPIHVAASAGVLLPSYCSTRQDAINDIFLRECPDTVGLRDSKGRTFLHVAVEKERRFTVFFVRRTQYLSWILNMQDNEGNTALHLAVQAKSFRMVCALIGNKEVNLNLINNKGETPMDIAGSKLPCGIGYFLNPENKIYSSLWFVGAKHGALHRDKTENLFSRHPKPNEQDEESDQLKDATQTLIVASALIATVAFSATFALPGGYRADDHTNGGTPTLAGSFVFDAFMVATTLAFTCSTLATIGFAFAAAPMVNLVSRRVNFINSLLCMSTSITCMTFAFALGVYMVLAPVARNTAVAVCVIIPAILLVPNMEEIFKWLVLATPLMLRKGTIRGTVLLLQIVGMKLWPCIVIFGWAALARIHGKR